MENRGEVFSKHIHKKIYAAILFAEFWEMFSFFGIVSILVMYTTGVFSFSEEISYQLYGIYLTLFCGLTILGGLLTDKYFTSSESLLVGAILMLLGNISLMFRTNLFLFSGLSASICGAALFKPACTNIIGKLTEKKSNFVREKVFSRFYVALNMGAMSSPFLYGLIGYYFGLKFCFIVAVAGIFFSSMAVNAIKQDLGCLKNENCRLSARNPLIGYLLLVLMFIGVTAAFFFYDQFDKIMLLLVFFSFILFHRVHKKQDETGKKGLLGLLILLFCSMMFFTASLQVGSALTFYIDTFVQKRIYHWDIPTSFFTSLNPLFLVLMAPLFEYLWRNLSARQKEPSVSKKLSAGLILGGMAFFLFSLSSMEACLSNQKLSLILIVLGYLFLGAGEICLAPAVLNAIHNYAPKALGNTMMGAWYLFMAFSGYLGELIDITIIRFTNLKNHTIALEQKLHGLQITFELYTFACLVLGGILYVTARKLEHSFFGMNCSLKNHMEALQV